MRPLDLLLEYNLKAQELQRKKSGETVEYSQLCYGLKQKMEVGRQQAKSC